MQAHSGTDPMGSYLCFLKKDPIRNIDVVRDDKPLADTYVDYGFMKNKVPSGTGTHIFKTNKLDREGKLDRAGIKTKELPRNKTDHVSYEPPTSNRFYKEQRAYDIEMTKPRYSANVECTDPWMPYEEKIRLNKQLEREAKKANKVPASQRSNASQPPSSRASILSAIGAKTLNNRSSVKHNIITGEPNVYSQNIVPGLLDKQVCNRKQGITQHRDLAGPNSVNRNGDYMAAWDKSNNVFKRQNGIFTHLYNAAARFGESEVFKA